MCTNASLQITAYAEVPSLDRGSSHEHLEVMSNADSTLTSTSALDLRSGLDFVHESHDRITKVEVQLDVSKQKDKVYFYSSVSRMRVKIAPPYLTWSNGTKFFKQYLFIKIT